jgi:Raf kinase inhibitor-like YbhB/YbcL family protein
MTFSLTSPAFVDGGDIPSDHTCDGSDAPIPLEWSGVPAGAAELALVMDDPDAGGFVHWVVVSIPADATSIDARALPTGAVEGRNSFGGAGYRGPCPPSGTHRYVFNLLALSSPLGLSGTPSAQDVRAAAASNTVGQAQLTGRYTRSR